jgi:hypothetical protein
VTDGVFMPAADRAGGDTPPAFLPARSITQADLAALTARVRRRVIRWFRLAGLLDAAAGGHRGDGHGTTGCRDTKPDQKPRAHDTSRIVWAKLMARVGEEFPLECPNCGGDIRLIAFITEPGPIRKILTHLGEPLEPTRKIRPRACLGSSSASPSEGRIEPDRPRLLPLMIRAARPTLAEVPLADLSSGG